MTDEQNNRILLMEKQLTAKVGPYLSIAHQAAYAVGFEDGVAQLQAGLHRMRNEALEEAAKRAEAFGGAYGWVMASEAAAEIRAMKGEVKNGQ